MTQQLSIENIDDLALDQLFYSLNVEDQINLGLTSEKLWKHFEDVSNTFEETQ